MTESIINLHRRARMALSEVPEGERATILATLELLRSTPPDLWPPELVEIHKSEPLTYKVRVSPEFRAFISPVGPGEFEVVGLANAELLKWMRERWQQDTVSNEGAPK